MLSRKIGIDLGSSTVRIFVKGEGVVLNERSQPAPGSDSSRMLRRLIGRASGRVRLFRPDVVVSVPSAVSSGERKAVAEAAMAAGARQVWLIDEPLAAAMGAGLPIGDVRASAICEIGASTTEIAVISLSGTVVERAIDVGGNQFDQAIAASFGIDLAAAEALKIAVGSALTMTDPLEMKLGERLITSNEVAAAIGAPLRNIADALVGALAEAPRELASDVRERGVVLSGGGAQLRALDRYITQRTGIPASVAEEPQTSVVRGTGLALESFEVLRRNQSYAR